MTTMYHPPDMGNRGFLPNDNNKISHVILTIVHCDVSDDKFHERFK